MLSLEININSGDLAKKLKDYTDLQFTLRSKLAMMESVEFVKDLIQYSMPEDTGVTRGNIVSNIYGEAINLTGVVGTNDIVGKIIEFGRAPGSRPPPKYAIYSWLQRHGTDNIHTAYLVARSIGIKGIVPRHIFSRVYDVALTEVPLIWKKYF